MIIIIFDMNRIDSTEFLENMIELMDIKRIHIKYNKGLFTKMKYSLFIK